MLPISISSLLKKRNVRTRPWQDSNPWPPGVGTLCRVPRLLRLLFPTFLVKGVFSPFSPAWVTIDPYHLHYHVVNPRLSHCNLCITNLLILPYSLFFISPNSCSVAVLILSSFDCHSLSWLLILKTVIKYTLPYPLNFVLYLDRFTDSY